jgi:GDP-4-dehydro-6-deoxy-D-mannose reductase
MKVLVTGISGFVGLHLTEFLLKKKFKVVGTVFEAAESLGGLEEKIEIFKGDLLDPNFARTAIKKTNPNLIFHLASFTSPASSFGNPYQTLINNAGITINLLEAAKEVETRILIVGSADEYGLVGEEENPVKEDTPLRPANPYAVSKLTQDFLGLQYFLSYNLKIVRVRPGNQIGPGQRAEFVVSSFAKQIAAAEKGKQEPVIKVGNLEAVRDFTDVRDMVRAYHLAILNGKPGEVYNLGSGRGVKIREVLNKLICFSKVKVNVEQDPTKIRPVDMPKLIVDASRFKKLTGWQPKIGLDQSLLDILNCWRETG